MRAGSGSLINSLSGPQCLAVYAEGPPLSPLQNSHRRWGRVVRIVGAMAVAVGIGSASIWQATASANPPNSWALLAAGPRTTVLATQTGTNTTLLSNGTYFYNNPNASMGFAPNATIKQGSADVTNSSLDSDPSCTSANGGDLRLSWHRSGGSIAGGWRYGCATFLNSDNAAVRAVFQSNSPTYYPSGPQKNVNHSLLLNSGWSMCFIGGYGTAVTFTTVTNACTQTYIILAGGTGGSVPVLAAPTITSHTAGLTNASLTFGAVANASSYTAYLYAASSGGAPILTVPNYTSGASITGLTNSTTYYATLQAVGDNASYATSSESTPRYAFTTLSPLPVVTSTSVAGITMTSADLSATVTSSETTVSARGFVIATTDGPTLGAAGVTDVAAGTGTGAVTATPTGLTRGTTYYVRAYATNTAGTAYGATQVFSTAPNAIATTAGVVRWFDGPTIVDAGVTVEGEDLAGATVSIDNNATGDVLACPDTSATGITCSYSAATGVLTLTGSATAATYQTVLRGVTFEATDVGTVVTTRSVTFNLGGSLTFDPATGHYYEIVTVSSSGATYAGGAQDPDGTQGDLGGGSGISWEEARCRAKYSNARFGGTLMVGSTREVGRTTQAADGCVALDGSSPLETRTLNGLSGHLANITALTEHQFLRTKLTGTGWIGGADVDTEGTWIWMDGPEAGEVFWIQGTTSTRRGTNSISGVDRFNYWSDGEPNDAGGEHWAEFGFGSAGVGSSWNDCRNGCGPRTRYVVEYSASGGVVPPVLSASRSMSPLPAQTITFNTATELVYGASAPSLTATSSSGLAVTLAVTSGDGTTCTLTGTTLTWVAPGSCTVTATQAGDDSDGGVQPAPPVARTITMARSPLPITGLTATARAYDGTSTVGVTGTPTFDPADLVAADVGAVSVGGSPTATLSSTVAGVARAATVSGLTLSGARAFAYEPTATLSVDISPREVRLDGTFAVADRGFDGTSAVTPSSQSLTLRAGDVLAGDAAALGLGTVTFAADSAAAGTRTATPTAATLTGARSGDYVVVMTDAPTATFTITAVPLTIASGSFSVADKVYDGTDAATVSAHSLVLTGFAAGDSMADIAWTPSGRFTLDTAGTGRTVELVGGAVFGGAKGGGYTLDVTGAPTATASITPRPVTVTGASVAPRPYDGTTAVAVSGATLGNTVAGDVVSLVNATSGVAASRNAGTQAVSTAMTLSGADAANYRLSGQPSLSVTISPLPVSVTMNALPSRPYDGTTVLTLSAGAFSVSGVLPGESIAVSGTGRLSSRAAGTRTLTVAPTYTPGGGGELSNYQLPASVSGTVTITPLPLRIVGATVTSRAWDGSTAATITGAALEGVRAGDAVSLAAASSGVFTSAQPGTHSVRFTPSLVGVDAINYALSVPELTGTITRAPATLRITGGVNQFADGSPRSIRAAVSPAGAGRVVVSYGGGGAPTEPGSYPVTVTLDSSTHEATALSATLTVQPVDTRLDVVAVRPDGTLALPEIGPVLEDDGTAPALRPNDRRVLADGEPVEARVIVVEDERVRIETDIGFAIELQAATGDGEARIPLPVDADGTLLLDRGGFVDVGGTGFLAGSTAEVWMFSTATFLGTAIVGDDGSFAGSFPVDELLEAGEHTIQLNGIGADGEVLSTSLGVRIEDLEDSARERFVFASERGDDTTIASSPAWLLLVAALIGAGAMRWWIVGRRRRDEDEQGTEELTLRS